jgi:uncharacterized protein YlxW (UPF0749 family)
MKIKREEKLESTLKQCRADLHKEKQKNRDLQESRNRHKSEVKSLRQIVKEQNEELKKNGNFAGTVTTITYRQT